MASLAREELVESNVAVALLLQPLARADFEKYIRKLHWGSSVGLVGASNFFCEQVGPGSKVRCERSNFCDREGCNTEYSV